MSKAIAAVAQLVEYVLGKDGVMGSSPISSFRLGCLVVVSGVCSSSVPVKLVRALSVDSENTTGLS